MNDGRIVTPQSIEEMDTDPIVILAALHKRFVENSKLVANMRAELADVKVEQEMQREKIAELSNKIIQFEAR